MHIFEEKEEVEVSLTCKICLKEIKFPISAEEYESASFPIKKETIHGTPKHKLVAHINRNLEIENFELEEIVEEEEELDHSEELTRQVLSNIGLSTEEVEVYLQITGRDTVSLGEMEVLTNKSKEETQAIADSLVEKGLFKKVVGRDYYNPLPPYSALVNQLRRFHTYIAELKKEAPAQLNESFSRLEAQAEGVKDLKDYTDFIEDLKRNTLSKLTSQRDQFDQTTAVIHEIGTLGDFINNLEVEAKEIMDNQIKGLAGQFGKIRENITLSMDRQVEDLSSQFESISTRITQLMKDQIESFSNQFDTMKSKIKGNIQKLRLGVLQQAVDQIIEMNFSEWLKAITENLNNQLGSIEKISKDGLVKAKISLQRQLNEIQKVQNEGLESTSEIFKTQLVSNLKESIDNTVNKIKGITNSTAKSGDEIKQLFENVSNEFSKAVTMAEGKLGGISEKVFDSFDGLKEIFTKRVINALNDILNNILERLELSEKAIEQFWAQAVKGGGVAGLTMQDVWFIRSIEDAKAHVNDELSKAKMRVLIVTPQISDVNLESIKACRSHINIRIAANIDMSISQHKAILDELNELTNVSYRNRKLQNLLGISRDYEEVVLCVISKKDVGIEVAGIGSIIEEHIKIFVPVLEEAWRGAQKVISGAISQVY